VWFIPDCRLHPRAEARGFRLEFSVNHRLQSSGAVSLVRLVDVQQLDDADFAFVLKDVVEGGMRPADVGPVTSSARFTARRMSY